MTTKERVTPSELLAEGVGAVITDVQAYFRLLARLHQYSVSNCMLILKQKPEATMVAGYRRWQEMGRHVRKGERAIRILAPLIKRKDDGTDDVFGYRIANVFDVSQTEGEPLPEQRIGKLEPGMPEFTELYERAQHVIQNDFGLTLHMVEMERGFHGAYSRKENAIKINTRNSINHQLKSMVHEMAHALTMDVDMGFMSQAEHETIAEGVAYMTLYHFGLDTGSYSFTYIATYAEEMPVLTRVLADIRDIAKELIAVLEGKDENA